MEIVTLTNQKGGVGKTTTALHLATGLCEKDFKVLMVDLDPQSNLSYTAGADYKNNENTIYNVFRGNTDIKNIIQPIKMGLDIAVGGLLLAGADMEFNGIARETMLKEQLEQLQAYYDYCVIDTPPTLGVLLMNALTASDKAILPLYADAYSIQGIEQLTTFIQSIQKHYNKGLAVDGLLITKYNARTVITQVLQNNIQKSAERLNTKVYNTKIRETVKIIESQAEKRDIFTSSPNATASEDYRMFIDEFLGNK
jgi:chromosome partitioning protein